MSERTQRQVNRLLDEADEAIRQRESGIVRERALAALYIDADNADAQAYLATAQRNLPGSVSAQPAPAVPVSFANGRYQVLNLR